MKVTQVSFFGIAAFTLMALAMVGCGKSGGEGTQPVGPRTLSFQSLNDRVLGPNCVSCHQTATASNHQIGLASYDAIMKSQAFPPLVVAGKPEQSSLYLAVANDSMPKGGPALAAEDKKFIYDWIKAGAPLKAGQAGPTGTAPAGNLLAGEPCDRNAMAANEPGYSACH